MSQSDGQPSKLSLQSEAAVALAIGRAALTAERAVCTARAVFYAAILIRFLLVSDLTPGRLLLTASPLLLSILFSVWVLARVRTPPAGQALWTISVLLDSCTAFLTLLPNALWIAPEQRGILFLPDTVGILVATIGAGLRLSPRAALAGGLANCVALVVLVLVDRAISGARFEVSLPVASMYLIFVGGTAALAVILALVTRRLAHHSALAAKRADLAEQGLGSVLADSHDLSSLLTAATIGAELMVRELERPGVSDDTRGLAQKLADSLRQVRTVAIEVRCRAMGDLTALNQRLPVELAVAVEQARQLLDPGGQQAIPIRVQPIPNGLQVLVAGGQPTLHRILLNLLHNACEGDARGHASHLDVRVVADATWVQIHIEDDGPGLRQGVLDGEMHSTKTDGTGIGLSVARGLTEASGGTLTVGNRGDGGAAAVLVLAAP